MDTCKRAVIKAFSSKENRTNSSLFGEEVPKNRLGSFLSHPLTMSLEAVTGSTCLYTAFMQPLCAKIINGTATTMAGVVVDSTPFWALAGVAIGFAVPFSLGTIIHHSFANPPADLGETSSLVPHFYNRDLLI